MITKKNKDWINETVLEYKNLDGSKGWIIQLKTKKESNG